ncbi:Protein phosphatase 2C family protein [Trifolium repens]|nr:Protein phosphatase 2C family protein [Trifolium repens]
MAALNESVIGYWIILKYLYCLSRKLRYNLPLSQAIHIIYVQAQEMLSLISGCLICIIWRGRLFFANVGNSRAILGSQKGIGPFKKLVAEQMVCDHSFRNPVIQQEFTRYFSDGRSHYECIEVKDLIETTKCIGYAYMKRALFTTRNSFEIQPWEERMTSTFTGPLLSI